MARKRQSEEDLRAEVNMLRRIGKRVETEKSPERLNRIKEVLESKKMTQQQLANLAKIGFASINMYYNGKREPSLETLKKIAEALKVSGKELINF